MVMCQTEKEREEAIIDNEIQLSYTEKRIWDMWRRWRMSEKSLWPWQYMTNNIVYANDMIDLECMESIVTRLEKKQEEYKAQLERVRNRRNI